jgi:hypothetical protein
MIELYAIINIYENYWNALGSALDKIHFEFQVFANVSYSRESLWIHRLFGNTSVVYDRQELFVQDCPAKID